MALLHAGGYRGGGCVKSQKKSHAHLTRISRAISRRSRVHPAYIPCTSHAHPTHIPRTSPRKSVRIPGYPSCMYADPHYTAREIPIPRLCVAQLALAPVLPSRRT